MVPGRKLSETASAARQSSRYIRRSISPPPLHLSHARLSEVVHKDRRALLHRQCRVLRYLNVWWEHAFRETLDHSSREGEILVSAEEVGLARGVLFKIYDGVGVESARENC